jgi:hypothetical protein
MLLVLFIHDVFGVVAPPGISMPLAYSGLLPLQWPYKPACVCLWQINSATKVQTFSELTKKTAGKLHTQAIFPP